MSKKYLYEIELTEFSESKDNIVCIGGDSSYVKKANVQFFTDRLMDENKLDTLLEGTDKYKLISVNTIKD